MILKKVCCEFDACVDHAAVVQIMKAKTEPATSHIMHLLADCLPTALIFTTLKERT